MNLVPRGGGVMNLLNEMKLIESLTKNHPPREICGSYLGKAQQQLEENALKSDLQKSDD